MLKFRMTLKEFDECSVGQQKLCSFIVDSETTRMLKKARMKNENFIKWLKRFGNEGVLYSWAKDYMVFQTESKSQRMITWPNRIAIWNGMSTPQKIDAPFYVMYYTVVEKIDLGWGTFDE